MIYLDNAATSFFKPESLKKIILEYLNHPGSLDRGVNSQSIEIGLKVFESREKVAEFFHFKNPERVIWTSGVTESLNICINSLFSSKSHIITSFLEHNSVLRPLYRQNCDLSFSDGTLGSIKKLLKPNTKAIVLNHASNVTGEINDIIEIGAWAKENNLLFILDTAQSAGVVDIDINKANVDFLCFSAHKGLLGLQGLGGLVINSKEKLKPLKVGGTGIESFLKIQPDFYPNALEAGTQNIPGILALSQSLDYINNKGVENINKHEQNLKKMFLCYLEERGDVEIYQNKEKSSVGVVSFNIKGFDSSYVCDYLNTNYSVILRSGALCAPLVMDYYKIPSCARVSFGLNNTEKDVQTLINALDALA